LQSEEDYNINIDEIKNILKGNLSNVIKELKNLMKQHSTQLDFENAHLIKEKITTLESYRARSTVVNPKINNIDIFSIVTEEKFAYVNCMRVSNGAIVQAHTTELKKKLEETEEELLAKQRFMHND
jgi:excinuclease ABC subunit C